MTTDIDDIDGTSDGSGDTRRGGGRRVETQRVTLRLPKDVHARVAEVAHGKGLTVNEFVTQAVRDALDAEMGNYPLPTLEQARLAQLVDAVRTLSDSQDNLRRTVLSGFSSIIGLARGDNYLMDDPGAGRG